MSAVGRDAQRVDGGPPVGAAPPSPGSQPARYVGLTTRAIAFAIDAAIINIIAIVAEVGGGLIVSVLHLPKEVRTVLLALGGALYILWTIGYFVVFWSTTGQTPGNRVMQFRVVTSGGEVLKPRRALLRVFGLVVAALPLLAGYFMILFDRRRRGLQDRIAGTVVVEAPQLSIAQERRTQRRVTGVPAPGPQPRPARSSDSGDDRDGPRAQAPPQRERLTPDSADRT